MDVRLIIRGKHQGVELLFRGEEGQREGILAYYSYINDASKRDNVLAELAKELERIKRKSRTASKTK